MTRLLCGLVAALVSAWGVEGGTFTHTNQEIVFVEGGYALRFSEVNGAMRGTVGGTNQLLFRTGTAGLWQAIFQDGSTVQAGSFAAGSAQNRFAWSLAEEKGPLRLTYSNAQISATVTISGVTNGAELTAEIRPRTKTLLEFALPGRLSFEASGLKRFVGGMNANETVGAAFKAGYFEPQPAEQPAGWQTRVVGPSGYATLFGGGLVSRADNDPATNITISAEGRAWLGEERANKWSGSAAVVNRPSTRTQAQVILADSAHGPYFCGNRLGGAGWLLRIGGKVREAEKGLARELVVGAMEHVARSRSAERTKVGLIALVRGPASGGWTDVTVEEWRESLLGSMVLRGEGVEVVELKTAGEMLAAAAGTNFLAILNPYGEWTPVVESSGMGGTVAAVRGYVRGGGCWVETGGYPFYYELRPAAFYSYETLYPPAFADFMYVEGAAGEMSVYGVQPQVHAPWSGATNPAAIFVPGRLAWGGEAAGGYCERRFAAFVSAGQSWQSPRVRLAFGLRAEAALKGYAEVNGFNRRLEQKLSAAALERFKRSLLVYYSGSAAEKLAHLERLPAPALVHFADYLKGGFDKEYPDHLPPNGGFGTTEEFRAFIKRCRELGHLVMPYTNPTWWCDHPRGPTFLREGEAPLLRRLDGTLSYERYGDNDGYTVSHWHPAVRAANAETLRQFVEEFPVDLLFQDQCGARSWQYDLNGASPTRYAYSDGLISMVAEDCGRRALSTENGWDRIANYEAQFCGMTWGIVPTRNAPSWRTLMKERIPAGLWEVYPLAQHLAHDQVAMVHHDLGQFVTDEEILSWTLGLGYGLSVRVGAAELEQEPGRQWLLWLDRVQKSVCARFIGEPVTQFAHGWKDGVDAGDDGMIAASYGPVTLTANLGPAVRSYGNDELAGYGFRASAPGLLAGHLARVGTNDFGAEGVAFVSEGDGREAEFWVYSPGDRSVAIELPERGNGTVEVQLDGERAREARVKSGVVAVRLGMAPGASRLEPPVELKDLAPRFWPAGKPAIGVLDIPNMPRSWTTILPGEWREGLVSSRLGRELGAPIQRITSVAELVSALQAGPAAWLAIINPGGENFPVTGPGQWPAMLGLIRDYVNRGGSWFETAGYSFYSAGYAQGSSWLTEWIGPAGMAFFGLPVDSGAGDQPTELLSVTGRGREILGDALADQIEERRSSVNRGLPRTKEDPGHVAIVGGKRADFIGGYRLGGWGFLWRIGGFTPNRTAVVPAVTGILEYLYSHPPPPVDASSASYLWHGTATWKRGALLKSQRAEPAGVEVAVADCPPGAINHLERTSAVDGGVAWTPVFTFQSTVQETNWFDPDSLHNPRAFYRVRSEIQPTASSVPPVSTLNR